jgi:hypothetical protein
MAEIKKTFNVSAEGAFRFSGSQSCKTLMMLRNFVPDMKEIRENFLL